MPSFLDRLRYAPVEGDAHSQFEELHWGNPPRWETEVTLRGSRVRQRAVLLGDLRALLLDRGGRGWQFKRPWPWLVVGEVDNRLYLTGDEVGDLAARRQFGQPGEERELFGVHYSARKGSPRAVYWVHDFEDELPRLVVAEDGWPLIVGGSYFVAPEGIVG